eukprot:gene2393-2045_t
MWAEKPVKYTRINLLQTRSRVSAHTYQEAPDDSGITLDTEPFEEVTFNLYWKCWSKANITLDWAMPGLPTPAPTTAAPTPAPTTPAPTPAPPPPVTACGYNVTEYTGGSNMTEWAMWNEWNISGVPIGATSGSATTIETNGVYFQLTKQYRFVGKIYLRIGNRDAFNTLKNLSVSFFDGTSSKETMIPFGMDDTTLKFDVTSPNSKITIHGTSRMSIYSISFEVTMAVPPSTTRCDCMTARGMGCWKDRAGGPSLFPTLEGMGYPQLDGSYSTRADAFSKCGGLAQSLGMSFFAISDGGKCGAGNATSAYNTLGRSGACGPAVPSHNPTGVSYGATDVNYVFDLPQTCGNPPPPTPAPTPMPTPPPPTPAPTPPPVQYTYLVMPSSIKFRANDSKTLAVRVVAVGNAGYCHTWMTISGRSKTEFQLSQPGNATTDVLLPGLAYISIPRDTILINYVNRQLLNITLSRKPVTIGRNPGFVPSLIGGSLGLVPTTTSFTSTNGAYDGPVTMLTTYYGISPSSPNSTMSVAMVNSEEFVLLISILPLVVL